MSGDELWIIVALAFGTVLLGVQGTYWAFSRRRQEKKAINRRLALAEQLGSPVEVLDTLRRERGFGSESTLPILAGLEELVLQTGLRIDPFRLGMLVLGLGTALFLA